MLNEDLARASMSGVEAWLRAELPAEWVQAHDAGDEPAVRQAIADSDLPRLWRALGWAGLSTPGWPVEYGGLGLAPRAADEVLGLLASYHVPTWPGEFVGRLLAAPSIMTFGTEEQKRELLRPLARAESLWCQLFSEPGAGSDLAGLSTRAVRDGDVWHVNGQKVWSSQAHIAQWGLLLARTAPDAPKHKGITYFVLDMTTPGIEVRPLRQMTGGAEFNEVFFSDVEVHDSRRIGPEGEGWRVAMTTLANERSGLSKRPAIGGGGIDEVIRTAKRTGAWSDPTVRDRLTKLLTQERALQMTNLRAHISRERGGPGPEGSIGKLLQSGLAQRSAMADFDLAVEASAWAGDWVQDMPRVTHEMLLSRALTIAGGTSEIQRNIVAERVLGLPKEPDPTHGMAWKDLPR